MRDTTYYAATAHTFSFQNRRSLALVIGHLLYTPPVENKRLPFVYSALNHYHIQAQAVKRAPRQSHGQLLHLSSQYTCALNSLVFFHGELNAQ